MTKSEVYSWRLQPDLKRRLQGKARSRHVSLSELLSHISEDWMERSGENAGDAEEQQRLHAAAAGAFGAYDSSDPDASSQVRARVRAKLKARRDATARAD